MENTMKLTKCYWCGANTRQGVHSVCWENLKSFALSIDPTPDLKAKRAVTVDLLFNRHIKSTKDAAGRSIIGGRVIPCDNHA